MKLHETQLNLIRICYIETNGGGAFQTMQYTIQQRKEYLNLYSTKEEMELEKP